MSPMEYVLNLVAEEGAEIAQAAAKANRFGILDIDPATGLTNKQKLIKEINDLHGVLRFLESELHMLGDDGLVGMLDPAALDAKVAKVLKWAGRSVKTGQIKQLPSPPPAP